MEDPHGVFYLETDQEWWYASQYIGVVDSHKSFMVLGLCSEKYLQDTFWWPISNICRHIKKDMCKKYTSDQLKGNSLLGKFWLKVDCSNNEVYQKLLLT